MKGKILPSPPPGEILWEQAQEETIYSGFLVGTIIVTLLSPWGWLLLFILRIQAHFFLLADPGWPVKMKGSSQPGNSITGFTKVQPTKATATVKWQRSCRWGWKSISPVFYKQGQTSRLPHSTYEHLFVSLFTLRNYEMEGERESIKLFANVTQFYIWIMNSDAGARWTVRARKGMTEKQVFQGLPSRLPSISPSWCPQYILLMNLDGDVYF